jgi:hypothetical protein
MKSEREDLERKHPKTSVSMLGLPLPEEPPTDLQERLRWIERQMDLSGRPPDDAPIGEQVDWELAQAVAYLAAIVRKHLETGEQ